MPVFVEDPTLLSISRLKSDLIAHNVALPPAKSKKEVYVELHLKHVDQKHAGDFSSDEEGDPVLEEEEEEEEDEEDDEVAENGTMPDPSALTDDDLKAALLERGVKAGPVVASTRSVYEKKLRKLLEPERREMVNGAGNAALYSDSEEDEEEEEADEEGSKRATPESLEQSEPASLPGRQPQQDPADDAFKDLLPDVKTTPTGIYATRRRPIKGAAGRPVQYLYPDTPLSPTTLERREVERRVLPVKMQIVVFVALALILYLIYACVDDDDSPCLAVLDSVDQHYGVLCGATGDQSKSELLAFFPQHGTSSSQLCPL